MRDGSHVRRVGLKHHAFEGHLADYFVKLLGFLKSACSTDPQKKSHVHSTPRLRDSAEKAVQDAWPRNRVRGVKRGRPDVEEIVVGFATVDDDRFGKRLGNSALS